MTDASPKHALQPRSADATRPAEAILHVVLVAPEIPQNTGNIGRMCAVTGARLHLVHPLGFSLEDRYLRRAGMDYWRSLDVHEHADWEAFERSPAGPRRLWLLTTHATQSFWGVRYARGDGLVFGCETAGAPAWLHARIGDAQRIKVDQMQPSLRSLNLATCAGVATYEAMRQVVGGCEGL